MTSELQPQSATKMVLRSFSLNFRMFPTFLALGVICFFVPFAVAVGGFLVLADNMPIPGIVLIIVGFLLFLAASAYFSAATTLAVWLRLTGVKARVFQIIRRLHGNVAWKAVAVGFRVGLQVMAGFFLLLIPGLIWYSKYLVVVPAVIVEQVYGTEAMDRSEDLTEGHRWRLVGALFFFFVVYEGISLGANYGVAPLLIAFGAPEQLAKLVQIFASLLALSILPASSIFPVLMYFDLRNRKEAIALPSIREVDTTLGVVVGL